MGLLDELGWDNVSGLLYPSPAYGATVEDALKTAGPSHSYDRQYKLQNKKLVPIDTPSEEAIKRAIPFFQQYANIFEPVKGISTSQLTNPSYYIGEDKIRISPMATSNLKRLGAQDQLVSPMQADLPPWLIAINDLLHEGTHSLQYHNRQLTDKSTRDYWSDTPLRDLSPKTKRPDIEYWTSPGEVQARAHGTLGTIAAAKQSGVPIDETQLMKEAYIPSRYWPKAKVVLAALLAGHDPKKALESYKAGGITPFGNFDYASTGWEK